jgi:hypothetical protein
MPHGPISCRDLDHAAASQLEDGGEAAALPPREALLSGEGWGRPESKNFKTLNAGFHRHDDNTIAGRIP